MLAYAFSRPNSNAPMANMPRYSLPFPPPNTPSLADPAAVITQPAEYEFDESDQDDGIDLRRVSAELDRLLEEGLHEDDIPEEEEDHNIIIVYQNHQINRSSFMTKNVGANRMSRSL